MIITAALTQTAAIIMDHRSMAAITDMSTLQELTLNLIYHVRLFAIILLFITIKQILTIANNLIRKYFFGQIG